MFGGFFKKKKVLVTGVAGVKASWLALELLEAGSQVIGVDIKHPEPESNFTASGLAKRITFVQGDITDLSLMKRVMKDVQCIFHLAAMAIVGQARRNPLETYRCNTFGTACVLEALRLSPRVKYAVLVTTDKVYKTKDGAWVETDPLGATEPYPVSKACAEFIIADYYRAYLQRTGKRVAVARSGNVLIGGDFNSSHKTDGAGRLFVDCYDALMEGRPPVVFNPHFTRPYTYGLDILSGYMALMSQLDKEDVNGEAFNFGPHEVYGVENALVATKICELWGNGIMWKKGPRPDRIEPFQKQSLAWDKARQRLGWQPAYTLQEALRDTTLWYKQWAESGKAAGEGGMYEFNRELIHTHRQAARSLGIQWARG